MARDDECEYVITARGECDLDSSQVVKALRSLGLYDIDVEEA